MNILILKIAASLSFVLLWMPKKLQHFAMLLLQLAITAVTTTWAIEAFAIAEPLHRSLGIFFGIPVGLEIDRLSAFFMLVVNLTSLTGSIYAKGYLRPYLLKKRGLELGLHYLSFFWLHLSMLLVCMLQAGIPFLFAWELMSIASFFLVIFESENRKTIKTGIKYLIQMHVGFLFIFGAFVMVWQGGANVFGFHGLAAFFHAHSPIAVFVLFFVGFGIKAGFIPLHTWLPHAHPAAPSHVSGVMSGVMIKMGIYGILRVLLDVHTDLLTIGIFILGISAISGVVGVTLAIAQHDLKKLLAYHSIENIGIIGIGIGVGTIGLATGNAALAALGFAGGILHILNHSLFKSLLFYAAGNIYQQTHTKNIEQLGGLMKQMPKTALLFLLGALAISGLPPFNGFISEFLIYSGVYRGLLPGDLSTDMLLLGAFLSLVLIGGLAVFCFTKAFSIVFLGAARSELVSKAREVAPGMLWPKYIIALGIVGIGLLPMVLLDPLAQITALFTDKADVIQSTTPVFHNVTLVSLIMLATVVLLWWLRSRVQKKASIGVGPVWGCGYSAANPATHQYTATSFANNLGEYTYAATNVKKTKIQYDEKEIFPPPKKFNTHSSDIFEDVLISIPLKRITGWMEKMAVFQTGKLQHYLLYALVFIVLIVLLTLIKII